MLSRAVVAAGAAALLVSSAGSGALAADTYPTARAAAATAPHCFSKSTKVLSVERRKLPALPLLKRLPPDADRTRLFLVTYLLLKPNGVDKPGRHSIFAYVTRPSLYAFWHLAACGTGP